MRVINMRGLWQEKKEKKREGREGLMCIDLYSEAIEVENLEAVTFACWF